jgi:Na+/H+-translocating membrane pyrophosphatase
LASAWPALVMPALALAIVERTLSTSTPAGLLLVSFAAGAQALGPLALAFFGFGLLSHHTRGVATLARLDVEPRRKHGRLDEASSLASAIGSTHASLSSSFSLLLGLVALSSGSASAASSLGVAALATLAGITLVLVFGARTTRSAVLGARLVALEVERQLPRAGTPLAADFTPSYRACVDAALSAARGASVVELSLLLLAPFGLGALLRFGLPATLGAPLVGFATAAVLGSLVFTLGGRALRAVLSELRRRARGSDGAVNSSAVVQAESLGELVGVTAASSVEALGLVLALTVLCLAPLLR